jgi:hypothetical protein
MLMSGKSEKVLDRSGHSSIDLLSCHLLAGTEKNIGKNIIQDCRYRGRDLKQEHSEHECRESVLTN